MEEIKGLKEYVAWEPYRKALGLPGEVTEQYRLWPRGNITETICSPIR